MMFVKYKKIISLAVILFLVGVSIVWLERPPEGVVCPDQDGGVYGLSYSDGKGVCHSLSEFTASVVVINTWASWCPFCVEEMPDLATIADEYPHVSVISINRGESSQDAKDFLKTLKLSKSLHLLFDPEDSFYRYIKGFGMPETIFVDESGTTLFHKRGIMSLDEMRETIELLSNRVQPNGSVKNNSLCLGNGESCRVQYQ